MFIKRPVASGKKVDSYEFLCDEILQHPICINLLRRQRRTIEIKICNKSLIRVVAPKKLSQNAIIEYLKDKSKWIAKQIDIIQNLPEMVKANYQFGDYIFYLGRRYLICANNIQNSIVLDNQESCPIPLSWKKGKSLSEIVTQWLKARAEDVFSDRLTLCHQRFRQHFDCQIPVMRIRKMISRFGSMSCKDNIMILNQYLIHSPIDCIDYVIIHELCHIKHQNHSKRFYALQSEVLPEWPALKAELTKLSHSINLMRYQKE